VRSKIQAVHLAMIFVLLTGGMRPTSDEPPFSGVVVAEVDEGPSGLSVVMCREGFPAWTAGLRDGDVLVRIGHRQLQSEEQWRQAVTEAAVAGETDVQIQWMRQQDNAQWRRMGGRMPLLSRKASLNSIVQWQTDDLGGMTTGRSRHLHGNDTDSMLLPEAIDDGEKVTVRLKIQRVGESHHGIRELLMVSDGHRMNLNVRRSHLESLRSAGDSRRVGIREWGYVQLEPEHVEKLLLIVEGPSPMIRIVGWRTEEDRQLSASERDAIFAVLHATVARSQSAN
jgi:hypothetical protein